MSGVNFLKLETRNWKLEATMKEIHELDASKLAEKLSDIMWYAFDDRKRRKK